MSSGMQAMIGMGSLWRHRMSKTSSRKPSMVAIKRERMEDRYTASLRRQTSEVSKASLTKRCAAHLMVRELIDHDAFARTPRRVMAVIDRF